MALNYRDHAGDPTAHNPIGDTRVTHAFKERPVGRRVEVLLEVHAESGDQPQEHGVRALLGNHVGRNNDRAARAHDPLDLLERIAGFRQQVDDIARHDGVERVVRVVQVGDIRLLDDDVREPCELLACLLEHPLRIVGRDHAGACGGDGCGDRTGAARTLEHGVAGSNQPSNGCPRRFVHRPVRRIDDDVIEGGNPIPDHD